MRRRSVRIARSLGSSSVTRFSGAKPMVIRRPPPTSQTNIRDSLPAVAFTARKDNKSINLPIQLRILINILEYVRETICSYIDHEKWPFLGEHEASEKAVPRSMVFPWLRCRRRVRQRLGKGAALRSDLFLVLASMLMIIAACALHTHACMGGCHRHCPAHHALGRDWAGRVLADERILRPKALGRGAGRGDGEGPTREWTGRLQRTYRKIEQSERRLGRELGLVIQQLSCLNARLGASSLGAMAEEEGGVEPKEAGATAVATSLSRPARLFPLRSSMSTSPGSHMLPTIRSSYYSEDGDNADDWDEAASGHSDSSGGASGSYMGPQGFGGGAEGLASGLPVLPPRIVPTVAPAIGPVSGSSRSGGGGRAPRAAEVDAAAAVQAMGERLTRQEEKFDALLRRLPGSAHAGGVDESDRAR